MQLFSLALHLPNNEDFSLEVGSEDTFLKVLEELFFFEMLAENDEQGNIILYNFIDQTSGQEFPISTAFEDLFSDASGPIQVRIEIGDTLEEAESTEGENVEEEEELISVALAVQPEGLEMDVELPLRMTAGQLIEELKELDGVLQADNGHNPVYQIIREINQTSIPLDQSLEESGVAAGETLQVIPETTEEKEPELPQPASLSSPPFIEILEETPQEEVHKEDPPQDEILQEEVHQENPFQEEVLQEGPSQEEILQKEVLQEDPPQEEILQKEVLQEDPPQEEILQEEVLQEDPPQKEIPQAESPSLENSFQEVAAPPDSTANILFQFPEQLIVGEQNQCVIRLANDHIWDYLSRKKLIKQEEKQDGRLKEMFHLELLEHAIDPMLDIQDRGVKEHQFGEKTFLEWHFELLPASKGFTSLLLKATIQGAAEKDVFALNHECEAIVPGQEPISSLWQEYESLSILFWWSEWLKDQILMALSDKLIGKSLALLANFLQHQDEGLYDSLIHLQAQWNDGKTRSLNGLIPTKDWEEIQARISHAILELIADIENRNRLKPRRIRKHTRNLNKVKTVAEKVI